MKIRTVWTACAAGLVLTAGLAGCVSGKSNVQSSGRYIGDQTIDRIEPGKTNRAWVRAVLGEPTTREVLPDGVEIWKWEYTRVTTSSGSVFFVVSGKSREESARMVYVVLEGDTVKDVWKD